MRRKIVRGREAGPDEQDPQLIGGHFGQSGTAHSQHGRETSGNDEGSPHRVNDMGD
jgi:hypothetical protein